MSNNDNNVLLVVRAANAELCLWQLLVAAKKQIDPAIWGAFGLLEAEAFLEALATGGKHPLMKVYERRRKSGHPQPPRNERHARRLVVLAVLALERAGLGKDAARERVARALRRPALFSPDPSAKALEHWEDRMEEPNVADEILMARAIICCGAEDLDVLAAYFLAMAHDHLNPAAVTAYRR